MAPTLSSALTLSTLGLASKAFLRLGCRDFKMEGLEVLMNALKEDKGGSWKGKGKEEPRRRRGIVTICNHTSVVDDPMMWGMMPISTFLPFTPERIRTTSRNTRWTLGASDVMFTNPLFSKFFTLGQVIETVRGGGIFQPAIDEAVKKLQEGEWIHIFPEGKVNQPMYNPKGGLYRFKWGVSRIIMDSEVMPTVIPIWLSGFEDIMPETRKYLRPFPRPGKSASITIGQPITHLLEPLVERWKAMSRSEKRSIGIGGEWGKGGGEGVGHVFAEHRKERNVPNAMEVVGKAMREPDRMERAHGGLAGGEEKKLRIEICDVLTEELQRLGLGVEEKEGKDRREWRNAVGMDG